jgi:hypothetical protein
MATPPAVSAPWRPRVIRELTVATDMPSVVGGAGGSNRGPATRARPVDGEASALPLVALIVLRVAAPRATPLER